MVMVSPATDARLRRLLRALSAAALLASVWLGAAGAAYAHDNARAYQNIADRAVPGPLGTYFSGCPAG